MPTANQSIYNSPPPITHHGFQNLNHIPPKLNSSPRVINNNHNHSNFLSSDEEVSSDVDSDSPQLSIRPDQSYSPPTTPPMSPSASPLHNDEVDSPFKTRDKVRRTFEGSAFKAYVDGDETSQRKFGKPDPLDSFIKNDGRDNKYRNVNSRVEKNLKKGASPLSQRIPESAAYANKELPDPTAPILSRVDEGSFNSGSERPPVSDQPRTASKSSRSTPGTKPTNSQSSRDASVNRHESSDKKSTKTRERKPSKATEERERKPRTTEDRERKSSRTTGDRERKSSRTTEDRERSHAKSTKNPTEGNSRSTRKKPSQTSDHNKPRDRNAPGQEPSKQLGSPDTTTQDPRKNFNKNKVGPTTHWDGSESKQHDAQPNTKPPIGSPPSTYQPNFPHGHYPPYPSPYDPEKGGLYHVNSPGAYRNSPPTKSEPHPSESSNSCNCLIL